MPSPTPPSLPTLFCLHALGMSGDEFEGLAARLEGDIEVVGLDLPGFGGLSAATGVTVEEMVSHVVRKIRAHGAARWMILGHSMGGKVASVVASRTLSGSAPLFGLAGVVLLAASPPVPEPMDEKRRKEMLAWTDEGGLDEPAAREFVDANTASALPPAAQELALSDLARTSREAWRAWLLRGSREDWSDEVGVLDLPALIVSGAHDGDLGADTQRRLNGAVYPRARFVTVESAAHLLPLERPDEVADLIREFWSTQAALAPALTPAWTRLLASPRVADRTRGILARRAVADDPRAVPRALTPEQLITLRAIADRVVPQEDPPIDLAIRLDADLADDRNDGWRNAALPADVEAMRLALDALHGFADLGADEQDDRLSRLADGSEQVAGLTADGAGAAWFEDVRVHLVRIWLAHPASMARIGFDGFANGSSSRALFGYELLAAGEREAWEPPAEDREQQREKTR